MLFCTAITVTYLAALKSCCECHKMRFASSPEISGVTMSPTHWKIEPHVNDSASLPCSIHPPPTVSGYSLYNYKNISPDTFIPVHYLTKHTRTHNTVHPGIFKPFLCISGRNVPLITANYCSQRWWIAKRLMVKYQSH